ncbi:hypothetical protein HIM_08672 [Hirsutella minnesotensis 3608]|uniref:Alpha/beta hydrolase fold-3 domain-containing protein n=1 Tax=Hirsutella minnesotensis 3608 TaxID=1043627 RepID=A0A0F7ZH28_9HYPO|nr:hypothetical protein HIM_08672 [Hirsutella minnesotensis 3608]
MVIRPAPGKPKLAAAEMLDLVPGILRIAASGLRAAATGPWRGPEGAPTYLLHICYAVLRRSTRRLSVAQLQWILPGTDQSYLKYCKQVKAAPRSVDLPHGARGHWIGDPDADNVLLWYHGGGWCVPAMDTYYHFFGQLVASSAAAGKSLAVFALSYTLVPHARYPTQLRQAVGGDSAGASLALGVLSHLAHPHPAIDELRLAKPLAGAVCMAPWVGDVEGAVDDAVPVQGDLLTPDARRCVDAYRSPGEMDYYTDHMDAPCSWFEGFPVRKMLICVGGHEIFRPLGEMFAEKLKSGFPATELFVGEGEAHVAPVFNMRFGSKVETHQGRRIKQWLVETLP